MAMINFKKLKGILRDTEYKSKKVKDNESSLVDFTALLSNLIEMSHELSEEELSFITISLQNWITRKNNTSYYDRRGNNTVKYEKISIFKNDLGIAYKPEIAYTHPVIILEKIRNYVLVVPTTTSKETVDSAYHPIDNPTGDKRYRKIKRGEGTEKDCAVILTNATTISRGRLIERKGALNNINDENSLFNELKMKAFYYCFPKQYKTYNDMLAMKEWNNRPNDIY